MGNPVKNLIKSSLPPYFSYDREKDEYISDYYSDEYDAPDLKWYKSKAARELKKTHRQVIDPDGAKIKYVPIDVYKAGSWRAKGLPNPLYESLGGSGIYANPFEGEIVTGDGKIATILEGEVDDNGNQKYVTEDGELYYDHDVNSFTEGGSLKTYKQWDELSIKEKSDMMKVAVRNGITKLADIKAKYNEFAESGNLLKKGGPTSFGNANSQRAMRFFMDKGLSPHQAAGLVGNLWRESNLNPQAINPNGGAYGIAQWLGKRKKDLFAKYGKNPTLEQQLEFVWHELNTTHKKGLNSIIASRDANEAARNAFGWYEFSAGPEGAVAAMNKANQNGARSLNQGIEFASRILGQPVPSESFSYNPQQTYIPQETLAFELSNPEAFFAPLGTYNTPVVEREVEQPLVDAANQYSEEALKRAERRQGLNNFLTVLSLTNPNNSSDDFFSGVTSMLTGSPLTSLANLSAKGGNLYPDGGDTLQNPYRFYNNSTWTNTENDTTQDKGLLHAGDVVRDDTTGAPVVIDSTALVSPFAGSLDYTEPYMAGVDSQGNHYIPSITLPDTVITGKDKRRNSLKLDIPTVEDSINNRTFRSLTGRYFDTKEDALKDNYDALNKEGIYKDSNLYYKVRKGDSLWKIANEHGTDIASLKRMNPNIKGNLIHPGDDLVVGTSSMPSLYDVKKEWEKENTINTDNLSAIQGVKHTDNYLVIDKLNKTLNVYDKNNTLVYSTQDISTGKSGNDYNTITYVDTKGNIRSGAGNESTPAGITKITGVGTYHGFPSFTRGRGSGNNIEDIASSLHFGSTDKKNASNGCVRIGGKTLEELSKYIGVGTDVYTLPEHEGSRFTVKDGRLNFTADNPYGETEGDKRYWDDYNVHIDKSYSPLHIVGKNKSEDKRYETNRDTFISTLMSNKENLQKRFNLDSDTYNRLALMALGIAEQETKFGTAKSFGMKRATRSILGDGITDTVINPLGRAVRQMVHGQSPHNLEEEASRGYSQIKLTGDNKEMQKIYKSLGISGDNIDSGISSAIATLARLAYMYNSEVKGRTFTGMNNEVIDSYDALLYKWMGKNSELTNHTASPKQNKYIRNVKGYQDNYDLYSIRAFGGPLIQQANMLGGGGDKSWYIPQSQVSVEVLNPF